MDFGGGGDHGGGDHHCDGGHHYGEDPVWSGSDSGGWSGAGGNTGKNIKSKKFDTVVVASIVAVVFAAIVYDYWQKKNKETEQRSALGR